MTRAREKAAGAMTGAATAWLSSLDNDQLALAAWASPLDPAAEMERLQWFYTPTDHGGLAIRDQNACSRCTWSEASHSRAQNLQNVRSVLHGSPD
jgi:hypothetical protein